VSTLNEQMSRALLSFMEDQGVTKADVARRLGRAQSYVGKRLDGTRDVSMDIAGAVADLAGISPAALMMELTERMWRAQRP
jgi:cyanate lyase